jgi:hypothetical protein
MGVTTVSLPAIVVLTRYILSKDLGFLSTRQAAPGVGLLRRGQGKIAQHLGNL